jgi:tocopherol cyclase
MRHLALRYKSIFRPDMYHGWGKKKQYFEGWYFKFVNKDKSLAFAVIPGISIDKNGTTHSFIQILDGLHAQSAYYHFPASDFNPSARGFTLRLENNYFSPQHVKLALPVLSADIQIHETYPWPKHIGAPGVMGWFSLVPFMECYHGVVSMNHSLSGKVEWNGNSFDMESGLGYIEKDWGRSFPKSWIWMQSNHFNYAGQCSFMFSLAHIPWLKSHFNGFLGGLLLDGKLHRFATYTGAKVTGMVTQQKVELDIKQGSKTLQVHAFKNKGSDLISPVNGEMKGKVNESLVSHIDLIYRDKKQVLFEGKADIAGLEVAGEAHLLFK